MINVSVRYNNFDLSTLPGVRIVNYNVNDLPARKLNASKLARANRSLLTSAEYVNKQVQIMGFVGGDNHQIMQDNFDRLKGYIQEVEGTITVQQGTKQVEYRGTLNAVREEWGGPSLGFTLEFECSNPIGRESGVSTLFPAVTITTATLSKVMVVEGSFLAEPRFTVVIGSVVDGTDGTISLLNGATGKGIRVRRDWQAGDIMSINSDTMEVIVNTERIDFAGQFPTFLPGSRTLQYVDDFTSRSVTLSGLYNRQYA